MQRDYCDNSDTDWTYFIYGFGSGFAAGSIFLMLIVYLCRRQLSMAYQRVQHPHRDDLVGIRIIRVRPPEPRDQWVDRDGRSRSGSETRQSYSDSKSYHGDDDGPSHISDRDSRVGEEKEYSAERSTSRQGRTDRGTWRNGHFRHDHKQYSRSERSGSGDAACDSCDRSDEEGSPSRSQHTPEPDDIGGSVVRLHPAPLPIASQHFPRSLIEPSYSGSDMGEESPLPPHRSSDLTSTPARAGAYEPAPAASPHHSSVLRLFQQQHGKTPSSPLQHEDARRAMSADHQEGDAKIKNEDEFTHHAERKISSSLFPRYPLHRSSSFPIKMSPKTGKLTHSQSSPVLLPSQTTPKKPPDGDSSHVESFAL